jgi:hypothetical protein
MNFHVLSCRTEPSSFGELSLVGKPERTEAEKCNDCGTQLASLRRLPPFTYRMAHGEPGDFLTDGMVTAVSSRFVELFAASSLTGLSFSSDPIQFVDQDRGSFFMAYPKCTRTLINEHASGIVINDVRGCDNCRVMATDKIERIVLLESTWDGSDVFKLGSLFGVILVSQRFVDLVESHELSNFQFIPQEEYSEDFTFGK